jgi:hypothetical protein
MGSCSPVLAFEPPDTDGTQFALILRNTCVLDLASGVEF